MKLTATTLFLLLSLFARAQNLYFPPVSGTSWDTISPATLGWCPAETDSLIQFLDDKDTKAFIVLKDGKIALEKYFGTFTSDSIWYWASAGKSLTAFLTGIAQDEGLLQITDPVSNYLGTGWTSCSSTNEGNIQIVNQLTMTTGFDDNVPDPDCTDDTCLVCLAPPGTRWAYHNAPYHLVHDVIENASGSSLNLFTVSRLSLSTGISGAWVDHVYYSTPRSMARFGLLMLAHGVWNGDTLLHNNAYYQQMITPSQNINPSYGYLWWLNGQPTYMLPQTQFVFNGPLINSAPMDMYAALGKNDQKIYVVPSQNMVVIRMGESAGISQLSLSTFDEQLWEKLSDALCTSTSVTEINSQSESIYPNPSSGTFYLNGIDPESIISVACHDSKGRCVEKWFAGEKNYSLTSPNAGIYFITVTTKEKTVRMKWIVTE